MLKKLLFILTDDEKRKLAGMTIGLAILAVCETVSIGLIIPIMNLFVSDGKQQASSLIGRLQDMTGLHDKTVFLTVLIIVTMAVFLFKSIYSVFMLRFQFSFASSIYCRLTRNVMSSYLYKPYSFHLDNNSSVLFKNMMTEVGQFTSGFLSPAIIIASEGMIFAAIFILLICFYPLMTITLIAMFLAMMLVLNLLINRKIKAYSEEREVHNEAMFLTANEALSGVKEIQVNSVQDYFIGRFADSTKKYQDSFTKFSVLSGLPRYILETVLFFTMLTVLFISIYLRRPSAELIPMMTVMGAAALKLLPSINKMYLSFNSLHYYANSLDIVYSILKEAVRPPDKAAMPACGTCDTGKDGRFAFRLENTKFFYKEGSPAILDGLDIDIRFSATTAIVGSSGAGKSTLIDVLTGLLIPSGGNLYYAGSSVAVGPDTISAMRKKIGYVPQQIFLVDDTIMANIAFGKEGDLVDRKLLGEVIKMANLEAFIKSLPDGIDTPVGERGVRLSGGQRQRIGIARALYRNPEILILDEATSALDGASEAEVIGVIKKMSASGMAVVIVAHRLSTIANADLIYVMDRGRVAARGTFEELRGNSDIFNNIVHKKTDLKEVEGGRV